MADHDHPGVGSVAEEAARLLDALGGWASTAHNPYAAKPTSPGSAEKGPRCESCGAENGMGQAVTCQLCPVCQGINLLRAVHPETLDRLADLAGAMTEALRDIAVARRANAAAGSGDRASGRPGDRWPGQPGRSGQSGRVQDIPVADDDGTSDPDLSTLQHDHHEPNESGSARP